MVEKKKRTFWELNCNDILSILCAAAVPIALGIYTAITYQQDQEQAFKDQQLSINQTLESRQDTLYDQFLNNVYNLDKDGYLEEDKDPWAFANAYYRAAHRQLDPLRKGDVLQFLKEKQLIGRNNCSTGCNTKTKKDIIRLNELNFDNVHLKSETGMLNQLNLECVVFDQVSMNDAIFSYANLNGVSFDRGRLENANFGNSSLRCASFNGTDLEGVDFGDSDLKDAHFENVDLSKVKLTETQKNQARFTNVKGFDGTTSRTTTSKTTTKKSSTSTTTTTTTKNLLTIQSSTTSSTSTTEKTTMTTTIRTIPSSETTVTKTSSMLTTINMITTNRSTLTTTASTITTYKSTTASATTVITTTGAVCPGTLITFDDIPGQSSTTGTVPSSYKGLNWINAEYINTSITPTNSIYRAGLRSSPFVIYNTNGSNIQLRKESVGYFSFMFFQLTSALSFPHTVFIDVIIGAATQRFAIPEATNFSRLMECSNCVNVNTIIVSVTTDPSYTQLLLNSVYVIIDDVCVSF